MRSCGATLGRYALIGEALRGRTPGSCLRGFAATSMAALRRRTCSRTSRRRCLARGRCAGCVRPPGFAVAAGWPQWPCSPCSSVGQQTAEQVATATSIAHELRRARHRTDSYIGADLVDARPTSSAFRRRA